MAQQRRTRTQAQPKGAENGEVVVAEPEVGPPPTMEQLMAALQRERKIRMQLENQVARLYGENVELRTIVEELSEGR